MTAFKPSLPDALRRIRKARGLSQEAFSDVPDGHPKLLHLWPVKLLQAGRSDYDYVGVMAMREAASFRR